MYYAFSESSNKTDILLSISLPIGILVVMFFVITIIILVIKERQNAANASQARHVLGLLNRSRAHSQENPIYNTHHENLVKPYLSLVGSEFYMNHQEENGVGFLVKNHTMSQRHNRPLLNHISKEIRGAIALFAKTSKREVSRTRFELGEQIGKGNFGKVSKGYVIGLYNNSSKTSVAVKTISGQADDNDLENMLGEIMIMSKISPHLNLVSMIASCTSSFEECGELWLLLEYCKYGDLKNFLKVKRKEILYGMQDDVLNSRCLVKWAYDISNGMQYLVENKIMHGDLAARNVLIDEYSLNGGNFHVAKIADFGLSKELNEYIIYKKRARVEVPWRWMAPEYLVGNYFTITSDVWSFGVLLWEILSLGRIPYGFQNHDEVIALIKSDYRLSFPDGLEHIRDWSPQEMYKTISKRCLVKDPEERAMFSEIVGAIKEYLTQEEVELYNTIKENYHSTRSKNYLKLHRT